MHNTDRFIELDAARGIAILMMVVFHIQFDLSFFHILPTTVYKTGFWNYFGLTTTILFIGIAGVSATISGSRVVTAGGEKGLVWKFFRRGIGLILLGMLITVGTYIYLEGSGFVVFGILHLIGTCVILAPFALRLRYYNALIGICIILATPLLAPVSGPFWLIPIGIHPGSFVSVDYEPLIPWSGFFFLGMALGSFLYPDGKRRFRTRINSNTLYPVVSSVACAGRHSLAVYLVHQPVIVGILMVLDSVFV